jgi:hypothetical protein
MKFSATYFVLTVVLVCAVENNLCAAGSGTINMSGTWQFSLVSGNSPATINYNGQIEQSGNNLSGFAPFISGGSSCSNTATMTGMVSDSASLTIVFNVNGQNRTLTGTLAADGNSATGTYTSDSGGCVSSNSGTWTGTRTQQVLPQFAFGGGWYSALYFSDEASNPASFTVTFLKDDGTPLVVPSIGGSSTTVSIGANGTTIVEAPNMGGLSQGSVFMALPGGVVGYGVFRQSVPGISDQEAVVPLSDASTTSTRLLWDDTSSTTTFALVNTSLVNTTVNIVVRDSQGNVLGTPTIALGPNAKAAKVLAFLPGVAGVTGSRGSADFYVTAGSVSVLGLRFRNSAFTSIPTADSSGLILLR